MCFISFCEKLFVLTLVSTVFVSDQSRSLFVTVCLQCKASVISESLIIVFSSLCYRKQLMYFKTVTSLFHSGLLVIACLNGQA